MICDETTLFVDTNLGTHLAISVHPEITAGDLKSKLQQEHLSCFTDIGEIKVCGLKVKRRRHFYHLPDPIPLKSAFQGLSGTWFLQMDASCLLDKPKLEKFMPFIEQVGCQGSFDQSEPLKPVEIQTLRTENDSRHSENKREELTKTKLSMNIATNLVDFSRPETKIYADKNCNSICYDEVEVRTASIFPTTNLVSRKVNDVIEGGFSSAKQTHVLELVSWLDSERKEQRKHIRTEECLEEVQNNKHLVSENPAETAQSFLEKVSITGIISRYFSDCDEVNSGHKNAKYESEETQKYDCTGSTMRTHESSVEQKIQKGMVDSDTDTVFSFIASDAKKVKTDLVCMNKFNSSPRRKRDVHSYGRKARKTASFVVRNKARRSKIRLAYTSSIGEHKHEVGKRLIRAANSIRASGSRKKPWKSMFLSRCGKLPKSSVLVRNLTSIFDDFDG